MYSTVPSHGFYVVLAVTATAATLRSLVAARITAASQVMPAGSIVQVNVTPASDVTITAAFGVAATLTGGVERELVGKDLGAASLVAGGAVSVPAWVFIANV